MLIHAFDTYDTVDEAIEGIENSIVNDLDAQDAGWVYDELGNPLYEIEIMVRLHAVKERE